DFTSGEERAQAPLSRQLGMALFAAQPPSLREVVRKPGDSRIHEVHRGGSARYAKVADRLSAKKVRPGECLKIISKPLALILTRQLAFKGIGNLKVGAICRKRHVKRIGIGMRPIETCKEARNSSVVVENLIFNVIASIAGASAVAFIIGAGTRRI